MVVFLMNDKQVKGFTLVEIVIVVAMMVILSGVVIVSGRSGDRSLALDRAVHRVGVDVRRAMALTLRAQEFNCTPPGNQILYGYGVYFDTSTPNSYILFADCAKEPPPADHRYTTGGSNTDKIVETISLENGIRISAISSNPASITFLPPVPDVYINNNSSTIGTVTITLVNDNGTTKTVRVTGKGVIEAQ